jgi:hypothetical protein
MPERKYAQKFAPFMSIAKKALSSRAMPNLRVAGRRIAAAAYSHRRHLKNQ